MLSITIEYFLDDNRRLVTIINFSKKFNAKLLNIRKSKLAIV